MTIHRKLLALALIWILTSPAMAAPINGGPGEIPLLLLEPVPSARPSDDRPLLREIADNDPRRAHCVEFVHNEAAHFIRCLLTRAYHHIGRKDIPPLAVCLVSNGNEARMGYRLQVGNTVIDRPHEAYVRLSDDANSWSHLLLHEGGHAVHFLLWGRHPASPWTPLIHSTFAVTNPTTALTEGYAEHFETLWGQFGNDPDRQSFYNCGCQAPNRHQTPNRSQCQCQCQVFDRHICQTPDTPQSGRENGRNGAPALGRPSGENAYSTTVDQQVPHLTRCGLRPRPCCVHVSWWTRALKVIDPVESVIE